MTRLSPYALAAIARKRAKKCDADIEFLARLPTLSLEELDRLTWDRKLPAWKRVAAGRAIARKEGA